MLWMLCSIEWIDKHTLASYNNKKIIWWSKRPHEVVEEKKNGLDKPVALPTKYVFDTINTMPMPHYAAHILDRVYV